MDFQNKEDISKFYNEKCKVLEGQIENLQGKVDAFLSSDFSKIAQFYEEDPDVEVLLKENKKLQYRLNIMNKHKMDDLLMQPDILGLLEKLFTSAILKAFPEVDPKTLNVPIQMSKVGDYQCNAGMSLAKVLKKSPRDVGQKILDNFSPHQAISKCDLSGPGFINVFISEQFILKQVQNILDCGVAPPYVEKKKVVVDFSSPNIAKEMHVGHLRSTVIGECVSRLLEFLGHTVLRINHLGDWGTQFGMLVAYLQEKYPDFLENPPPIGDIQAFYKESKKKFDEDEEFKARAYAAVVKLQAHEPDHFAAWKQICTISLHEFEKVYERLNVSIIPRGESFYQERMNKIVKELDNKKFLSLEEGRKVMYPDTSDIPLTVVKSDGGYTYDTSDMATIKQRIDEEKANWIIYVMDAGQNQHYRSIVGCARKAGIYDPSKVRLDHVGFGVVLGEDKKKFKTRSGDTVRLVDLLNEGVARAADKLKEKEREKVLSEQEFTKAKEAVAYGCIKYADLSHDRTRDYIFSFDRMLDFRGNTAAYLLYALTRIRSIARTAELNKEDILQELKKDPLSFQHEKEWKLSKTLLKFPDVLMKLANDLYLHPLCEYLYEVSTVFTEFYDNCYCVEKNSEGVIVKKNISRLALCEATATIMQKCFDLLGIDTVERM